MKELKIAVLADGSGKTAKRLVKAAFKQFPAVKNTHQIFSFKGSTQVLYKLLDQIYVNFDLLIFTLIDEENRLAVQSFCQEKNFTFIDALGPMIEGIKHLTNEKPISTTGLLQEMDEEYFKKIHAIEFTLRNDDGKTKEGLGEADIILVGISRTSKTPLSVYLALEGYKVVNIPLVPGTEMPGELFQAHQKKIFALTIQPQVLHEIRTHRIKSFHTKTRPGPYDEFPAVNEEVHWAEKVYSKNPKWYKIDVTFKAIEETASEIIKITGLRQINRFKQSKRFS